MKISFCMESHKFAFLRSLSLKMALATAVVIIGAWFGAFWVAMTVGEKIEYSQAEEYTAKVAEIVIQSFDTDKNKSTVTPPAEFAHTTDLAKKLLELPQLNNLMVIAIDDTIQFSRNIDDIGKKLNLAQREGCNQCHTSTGVNSDRRVFVSRPMGIGTYHMPFPIPNQPQCIRCHKPEYETLGTLLVEMGVEPIEKKLASHRIVMAVSAAVSLVLALSGTLFFFRRMVRKPLSLLKKDMSRVEHGNFDISAGPESRDEIRDVFNSFASMTRTIEESRRELSRMLEEKSARVDDLNSELRRIYSNLIKMEHLSAIGTLSAQVVHEVRTPLNALNLNLQLLNRELKQHGDLESEPLQLSAKIGQEVERISQVLERFLDHARHRRSEPTRESMLELMIGVAALMQVEAAKSKVDIKVNVAPGLEPAMIYADEIRQILINLISNSIHAMPNGGEIKISAMRNNGNYIIDVEDNGSGIAEKDLPRIFTPFFTTRENGTGLGLAIVKRLLEEMGGGISVESEEGRGSRFSIYIPHAGN